MTNRSTLIVAGALALALSACARTGGVGDEDALEQRLRTLEERIEKLKSRPPIQPALRERAAVEAHRAKLLDERAKLLTRYTEQHPAIRDIDRKIHILEQQLLEP